MSETGLWIWIRVPLRALVSAIDALKERSWRRHQHAANQAEEPSKLLRAAADADDLHAEELKGAMRAWERGDEPPRKSGP